MRKNIAIKTIALILSVCMAFTAFCGVMPIEVFAEDTKDTQSILFEDYHFLGRGFNLLSDNVMENSYLRPNLICDDKGINAKTTYVGKTNGSTMAVTDMQKHFEKTVEDWDIDLEFEVKAWIAAVGLKLKFDTSDSVSYSEAKSSYFSSVDINAIAYLYDMAINGETHLLWNNLSDSFRNALINEQNLELLFKNYGTHMVTRYHCGGTASSFTSGVSDTYDFSSTANRQSEFDVNLGEKDVFSANVGIRFEQQLEQNNQIQGTSVVSNSKFLGGDNFFASSKDGTVDETKYNEWLKSLSERDAITGGNKTQILTDDVLELVPIWDILPDEYAARKAKLEKYFNEAIDENVAEFYGQYIYNEYNILNHPDYSQYADYTWISTPEELDAVRNNLNGKYFIINDIDLTSYEWEPIGTASAPFKGELIGNNVEVLGLSCLVSGNDTRFPGILGYNSGKISGIDISKWVDYPVQINDVVNGKEYKCTSVSGLPASFNSDEFGSTLIVDWSNETDSTVDKTFTIGSNVSSVYFIGNLSRNFSGLQIVVANRSTPIDIIFESFNYSADPGKVALDATATASRVSLIAKSGSNTIIGGYGSSGTSRGSAPAVEDSWSTSNIHGTSASSGAIAVSGKNIVFEGSGNMTVVGGNGGNGGSGRSFENVIQNNTHDAGYGGNGGNGGSGAIAISAQNVTLLNKGSVLFCGGSGGKGGVGGTAPMSDRDGRATAGSGGNGGNGGTGATAITVTNEITIYGDFNKVTIMPGAGGKGGSGGIGGEGDDIENHKRDNGGTGGNGGKGGDTKSALVANILNISKLSNYDNLIVTGFNHEIKTITLASKEYKYTDMNGAGSGGAGGKGGDAHQRTELNKGRNGTGGNGGKGGNAEYAINVNQIKFNGVKESSNANSAFPVKETMIAINTLTASSERSCKGVAGSGGLAGEAGTGEGGKDGAEGIAGTAGSSKATAHNAGSSVNRADTSRLGLTRIIDKQYYKYGLIDKSTISCKKYVDGDYQTLNNFAVRYTFDHTGIGTVAVHSGDVTAYYPVKVADVEIVKTEINNATKKDYYYGEVIEPPIVNIYYNNGKSSIDACEASNVVSGNTASLGTSTVNVKYENASASYSINVSAMPISGSAKINGTAQYGRTLSASFSVAPAGATYKIQWYRNSEAISGATGTSYTLTSADIGQSINYAVIGTGNYSGEIVSADIVAEKAPVTGSVSISGTAQPYSILTADVSKITPANATVSYQWYKNGAAISGATAKTYTLAADSVGSSITVKVTATGNYAGEITSPAVVPVAASANGTLTITGSASYGGTLKAVVSNLNPADAQYTYQWYRNGVAIEGANSAEYTVTQADIGKSVSVSIIGTNGFSMTVSAAAVVPEKESPAAPEAPKSGEVTINSVTLEQKDGYEYKMGDGEWQSSNVFTGLEPNTTYVFYQRLKETETSFTSPASEIEIKTLPIRVTGIAFDKTEISIIRTYSDRIIAEITPANASDKSIIWTSSNEKVATVDENGVVSAVSTGIAAITAKTVDGNFTASCVVEILSDEYTVTWNIDGVKTSEKVVYTEEINAPKTPEKDGYSFAGWTPTIPPYMPAKDLEFSAVFTPIEYKATFVAEGLTVDTVEFTVETTEIKEPQIPVKTGYTAEWEDYELGLENIVVNAVYTPITYTATFKADGKVVETIPFTVETESVEAPEIPEKAGYTAEWQSYEIKAENLIVNAVYTPITYTANFYVDDEVFDTKKFTVESDSITDVATPEKKGYEFIGWDKEIPSTMPANDLEFVALFKCVSDVSIRNNTGSKTIKYGETLRLTAVTSNIPEGAKILWYIDGVKKGEGETFNVTFESGTKTVEVKLADANGKILTDANGNEISESEDVTVKAGFFQKLISFFKNLFGANRIITQAFKKNIF